MAKKKKNEEVKDIVETKIEELVESVQDDELLGGEVEVKVTDEVKAEIQPKKEKKFYGYHPITGAEVWL